MLSFEKVAAMTLGGARYSSLYRGQGENAITKECAARCRTTDECQGFVLNYNDMSCMMTSMTSAGRRNELVPAQPPIVVSFFEKVCISGIASCRRLWSFERVIGYELSGFDDRTIPGVNTRLRCEELCLKEKRFVCRSGEFDYGFQQCRLSSEDRRSQPSSFRMTYGDVDYFENQCVIEGSSGCSYERRDDVDMERPDKVMTTATQQECQQLCDSTEQFICHSYSFRKTQALCKLSSDDTYNTGSGAVRASVGTEYYQKSNCMDLKLTCTSEGIQLTLSTREPFSGRIYSQSQPHTCQVYGQKFMVTRFTMPISGKCGVTVEANDQLTNTVVIQYHPLIQQRGDRVIKLYCSLEEVNKTISKTFRVMPGGESTVTAVVNATAPTPNISLRITDGNGTDVRSTRIGEDLYFRIEIDEDSVFGILARDLSARNGRGDLQILLIDANGCPTDSRIFPALEKIPGTKSLQSRFQAFKFSEDPVVRFDVNVHFCLEECAPVTCPGGMISYGRKRRSPQHTEWTVTDIVPDYPLVAAIVVEEAAIKGPNASTDYSEAEGTILSDELVCTTKTVVVVLCLGALFLQIGLLAACATCFILSRKDRHIYREDAASTVIESLPPFGSESSPTATKLH